MHRRILAAITILFVGSVVAAVTVSAYLNRRSAIESFHEQHDALVKIDQ